MYFFAVLLAVAIAIAIATAFVGCKMNEGEKNNENLFCTSPRLLQIIPIFNFPLCVSINEYIFSFYTTRTTLHQLNYRLYLSQVLR